MSDIIYGALMLGMTCTELDVGGYKCVDDNQEAKYCWINADSQQLQCDELEVGYEQPDVTI